MSFTEIYTGTWKVEGTPFHLRRTDSEGHVGQGMDSHWSIIDKFGEPLAICECFSRAWEWIKDWLKG